jgi:surface antigen
MRACRAMLVGGLVCIGAITSSVVTADASTGHDRQAALRLVGMPRVAESGTPVLVGADVPKGATCTLVARSAGQRLSTRPARARSLHAEWSWTIPPDARAARWQLTIRCNHQQTIATSAARTLTTTGGERNRGLLFVAAHVTFTSLAATPFLPGKGAGTPPPFGTPELPGSQWLDGEGVTVYSNGANWEYSSGQWNYVGGKLSGEKWQCVELVDRLILTRGWAPSGISGNAVEFWANAPSAYFTRHANGAGGAPVPGDILVFHDTVAANPYGHVAVVNAVYANSIEVVEQNASATGRNTLSWNGRTIGDEGTEAVTGWLHAKANNIGASAPTPAPPSAPPASPAPAGTVSETAGGPTNTWTDYATAGGTEGPQIAANQTVQVSCRVTGFTVADGNSWWYLIASSPWSGSYYASADAFYNDGATSGSLEGTPFVDDAVPACASSKTSPPTPTEKTTPPPTEKTTPPSSPTYAETTGSVAHTWTDWEDAGGTEGPEVASNETVQIACRLTGFKVADGNTWWYRIASSPWNDVYYVSADAFYNNGETSGSLLGTPFVDTSVPEC